MNSGITIYSSLGLASETGYSYFGARYYDSDLSVWLSVDPMADKYPSTSPFMYVRGNPVILVDPNGMNCDWFQNEKTGEVYYNSSMKKGQEGTGAMKGEGWKHMGENGMFMKDKNDFENNDLNVLNRNSDKVEGKVKMNPISKYPNAPKGSVASTKISGFNVEASFKADNAKSFMSDLGYDFKAIIYNYHSDITTDYLPEGPNVDHDNSSVERVSSSRYISKNSWLISTNIIGTYKPPVTGPPIRFGPAFSRRFQSWEVRKDTYGNYPGSLLENIVIFIGKIL